MSKPEPETADKLLIPAVIRAVFYLSVTMFLAGVITGIGTTAALIWVGVL